MRSRWTLVLVCLLCTALIGCARAPDQIIGVDNPSNPAASVVGATRHNILVATTRQPSPDPTVFLTGERSKSLHYAYTQVSVPPVHKPGKIERSNNRVPDPTKHFVVTNALHLEGPDGLWRA